MSSYHSATSITRIIISVIALYSHTIDGFATSTELELDSCTFSGSYQQSKELDGLSAPLLSKGVLYYDCRYGVIWKTIDPIVQSLVLLNEGPNYRVDDQKTKSLTGRQNKMLGQIINAFISNDFSSLSEHFEVTKKASENDPSLVQIIVLLPKHKRLKRAFKKITITTKDNDNQLIEMVDKKGLVTTISATKNSSKESEIQCALTQYFSVHECELLLNPASV